MKFFIRKTIKKRRKYYKKKSTRKVGGAKEYDGLLPYIRIINRIHDETQKKLEIEKLISKLETKLSKKNSLTLGKRALISHIKHLREELEFIENQLASWKIIEDLYPNDIALRESLKPE